MATEDTPDYPHRTRNIAASPPSTRPGQSGCLHRRLRLRHATADRVLQARSGQHALPSNARAGRKERSTTTTCRGSRLAITTTMHSRTVVEGRATATSSQGARTRRGRSCRAEIRGTSAAPRWTWPKPPTRSGCSTSPFSCSIQARQKYPRGPALKPRAGPACSKSAGNSAGDRALATRQGDRAHRRRSRPQSQGPRGQRDDSARRGYEAVAFG